MAGESDSYRIEKRYICKDGKILWADLSASVMRAEDGEYKGVISVIADITDRKEVEDALRVKTHELRERVKELDCLYSISRLLDQRDISEDEIIQRVVDLIPSAWQYPDITCARITLEDHESKTENFGEAVSKQTADVIVFGNIMGSLEVGYLQERPEEYEGPFLKEERSLIYAIAERVGRIAEQRKTEEALLEAYDELGLRIQDRTAKLAAANKALRNQITDARNLMMRCRRMRSD